MSVSPIPRLGASSARTALMDSAEVLIAERGMGVSLREIAVHAGQRNNSAVIYHFGSHDGLIAATLNRRMIDLDARRGWLLERLDARDDYTLADVMQAIIDPSLELPYRDGATHYARFVEQIRTHPLLSHAVPNTEQWPATVALARRARACVPAEQRRGINHRFALMSTTLFALMSDYERRGEFSSARGRQRASRELVAITSAILTISA